MAIPVQVQFFNSFLGLHEGVHSSIMPDAFSSSGSKNVWMDKYARVRKILGYDNQNASAITTDTGASATALTGLFAYRKTNSNGTLSRSLVGIFDDGSGEWEIHTSTNEGVNWTFREDGGANSVGKIADALQFEDELIICDGVRVPRVWDNSTVSAAGKTQSPTPTATDASTSGRLVGSYEWKLVSVDTNGVRGAGSAASSSLQLEDSQGSLSWTADPDTNVVGYEVYRTTGTGKVFYFEDYVDGRATTSYTSTASDLELLENRALEEHGDPPPTGVHLITAHKQRAWYGRTDANPRRVWYSDPGRPTEVWEDNNFIDFTDTTTVGDFITHLEGNYEGTMAVFLENAIFRVAGSGQIVGNIADWNRFRTNASIGTVSHRCVVRVPAGSKYVDQFGDNQDTRVVTLAYFTPQGDIRIWDGDNDVVISHPVNSTLNDFNYAQRAKVFVVHDEERSHITWYFATSGNTVPNKGVTWNYRFGVWYEVEPVSFMSGVRLESGSDQSILLAGEGNTSTGGFCYKLWTGNSFNGSNIEAVWFSKVIMGINDAGVPVLHKKKRWRWIDLVMQSAGGVTMTAEWFSGFALDDTASGEGTVTLDPSTSAILTSDGNQILTSDGNAILASTDSVQSRLLLKDASGNYLNSTAMRLKLYDNSTNTDWAIEAFGLAYQVHQGMTDRAG